jgi:hypothetical protein
LSQPLTVARTERSSSTGRAARLRLGYLPSFRERLPASGSGSGRPFTGLERSACRSREIDSRLHRRLRRARARRVAVIADVSIGARRSPVRGRRRGNRGHDQVKAGDDGSCRSWAGSNELRRRRAAAGTRRAARDPRRRCNKTAGPSPPVLGPPPSPSLTTFSIGRAIRRSWLFSRRGPVHLYPADDPGGQGIELVARERSYSSFGVIVRHRAGAYKNSYTILPTIGRVCGTGAVPYKNAYINRPTLCRVYGTAAVTQTTMEGRSTTAAATAAAAVAVAAPAPEPALDSRHDEAPPSAGATATRSSIIRRRGPAP